MESSNNSVGAVIVLYKPNFNEVNESLNLLIPQVDKVCLVDNSPDDNYSKIVYDEKIEYIPLLENTGIAKAQNIGIKYLVENHFSFVLFSDQDSRCGSSLISNLIKIYNEMEKQGYKVSAIGPSYCNKKTGKAYKISKRNIVEKHQLFVKDEKYTLLELHSIISSYSLVRSSLFNEIGLMEEELFIDGVDNEWCWRARYFNKKPTYMVADLRIEHFLGSDTKLPMKKSSPFRIYYQYRNFFRLARRQYTPTYWKMKNGYKYATKLFFYPLFVSPRLIYLKQMLKGIRDGLFK